MVNVGRIDELKKERIIKVEKEKIVKIIIRKEGKKGGVGDIVEIEMKDRKKRKIERRIEEFVGVKRS